MDTHICKKLEKSSEIKEKTIKQRCDQILNAISDKQTIEFRFDRNPKNFQPKEKNILEKIISIQNYYHAREKLSPKLNSKSSPHSNAVEKFEKAEHLENYDKLLDSEKEKEAFIENKSAGLVKKYFFFYFLGFKN